MQLQCWRETDPSQAAEAGFAFTAEQLVQALRQASGEAIPELDDEAFLKKLPAPAFLTYRQVYTI